MKKTKAPKAGSDAKSLGNSGVGIMPAKNDLDASMADHETRGHMNTLMDAHAIMSDPEKMNKVKKMVGRHKSTITSLSQLKDVANNFSANDQDGDE